MFKALKEFAQADRLVQVGDVIETASTRMIELGLVEVIADEVVAEKPKKEPKEPKAPKVKEVKEEVKDQILTEDSANVSVEKTEEKTEE